MSGLEDEQSGYAPLPPLTNDERRRVLDTLLRGNPSLKEQWPDDTSVPDRAEDTNYLTSLVSAAGADIAALADADAEVPEDEPEKQMGEIDVRAVRTKVKRASATAPSLASACTKLNLDPWRSAIRIDEATEEKGPVKSGILGDGCGLGKTLTTLSFLYASSTTNNAPFKPTLIVVPARVIDTWFHEISTTFGQHIELRLFYKNRANNGDDLKRITINTDEELQEWTAGLCPEDRKTGRTIVLTSYETWMTRTLELLPESKSTANAEATTKVENGQVGSESDESSSTTVQEVHGRL
ncbi:uncharacterized protein BDV14DRAFT_195243 [Aspergillus stella-maris]|uniref:uncharacterized protein n=1 Tax=Aspergillus stella-maris TaxID=1810926 RepID=UPI003CCD42D4